MKYLLPILLLPLLSLASDAESYRPTVGMHQLKIAEAGVKTRLVSIPFLRVPDAFGRLDGIEASPPDGALPCVRDEKAAFSTVSGGGTFIIRVTSGASSGDWFIVDSVSSDGKEARVRDDGLAGNLSSLSEGEAFAVHRLYSLNELFPETREDFPSALVDAAAMQVHFYNGTSFAKCWLSDGTLTDHIGWTIAQDGHLVDAGDLAILPGTSFLVAYPSTPEEATIQVNGVVPYAGLTVPVFPGYNCVSIKYTQALEGNLADPAGYLSTLGLLESGFQGGVDPDSSDLILALNEADGTFVDGYYYDTTTSEFEQTGDSDGIALDDVGPGRGFVIYNRGEAYVWQFNQ
jgi:hypothetical protein